MASMLRSSASRSFIRSLNATSHPALKSTSSPIRQQFRSQLCTLSRRPNLVSFSKPLAAQGLVRIRGASGSGSHGAREHVDKIDTEREKKIGEQKIAPTPETVSMESTVMPMTGMPGDAEAEQHQADDPQMMSGVYHDFETIRQTFSLENVPRPALYMGLAGVLPYMATSLGTVYCAFEINHSAETGTGLFLDHNLAEQLLHIIEPLQVGYGAVILSFLGAIHWGFEWAQYGGSQGYPRYTIGVLSTAVAWPTLLFPVEYALITQFLAFNFLYYTDVRQKTRGWTPQWYGIYRFVLTFIVGASIIVSLVGRGQVVDRIGKQSSTADKIRQFGEYHPDDSEELDAQETRRKYLGDEGGDADEEEEEEEDDDE